MTSELQHKAPKHYQPQNIEGKAAIVSGGTTGMGLSIAKLLAERGARVLIFGRDENDLKAAVAEVQQGGEVYGVVADQSRLEDIRNIFAEADKKLGGVDILVNNAAVFVGTVLDRELEEIRYGIEVNLLGYMACSREAIVRMKANGGGHIINVGSMSADIRETDSDVYVATKAAIQAFSVSLRKTANSQGIKVSLIEPGLVGTDLITKSAEKRREGEENGKMLNGDDIAECVHYILTQPARCDVVAVQIRPHHQYI
jgi:NADP-dependent 3-hydroxy acid dehydrogenase YdfG